MILMVRIDYLSVIDNNEQFTLCSFLGHGVNGCQYVNATSIFAGESVEILEDDQGDGWTRIQKSDGAAGFVPSSYLRVEHCPIATSTNAIDSGRF